MAFIWFGLLALAGETNDNGLVYFSKEVPYTDQLLSTLFDFPITTIRMALSTFEKLGMIEIVDNILMISNWGKYQSLEGLDAISRKEKDRERKRKERANKRLEEASTDRLLIGCPENVRGQSVDIPQNFTVTPSYISISNNSSSLSKEDKEDKDKGCGEKEKKEERLKEMFSAFYEAYGNKKGRKAAEKAFTKIHPDEELFKKIMDGVEQYHKSRNWNDGYRKEPATWLNGECWNDEYDNAQEVSANGRYSGNRGKDHEGPRTVYNLKPRFVGHKYDENGNDITDL